jgi:hypothetical protein
MHKKHGKKAIETAKQYLDHGSTPGEVTHRGHHPIAHRGHSGQDFNILGHAAIPGGHAGYGR